MVSFEEVRNMLDDIAAALPDELYKGLNGGVILNEGVKLHPESRPAAPLYIMGEYRNEPGGLGRYIVVYYGSFVNVHGYQNTGRQKEALSKTLRHEFLHHLESLGGERSLEIEDAIKIAKYKESLGS